MTSSKPRMAYLVNITSRAERDLAHLYRQINAEYSAAALKWYKGLKEAILSLQDSLVALRKQRLGDMRDSANFCRCSAILLIRLHAHVRVAV